MSLAARVLQRLHAEWLAFYRGYLVDFVYVLGDSHASVFDHLNARGPFQNCFDVTLVGGATALGLVNPNSRTDCLRIFRARLATTARRAKILLLLGEVDTGFVIWYRAQKYALPVEAQFQASLDSYFGFVDELISQGRRNIALMSAPLPTIPDNHERYGEVARLRREVTASQKARTDLTFAYNRRIGEFCRSRGLTFIDLDSHLLGENGLIRPGFLNEDPLDHHCHSERFSRIVAQELAATGFLRR